MLPETLRETLPETERFMAGWHAFVAAPSPALLEPLIAEDCAFRSPAFWNAKVGKEITIMVLMAVTKVVSEFSYSKEWLDGREIILEFDAAIEGRDVKGIDRITLNEEGQAVEFEVLVRPLNGLVELAQAMGKELGVTG